MLRKIVNSQAFQFALTELEEQLMIPMLEWNYQLAEQFMTEKLPLLVGGERNLPLIEEHVGFEDIFGQYRYTWKGAQGVREHLDSLRRPLARSCLKFGAFLRSSAGVAGLSRLKRF